VRPEVFVDTSAWVAVSDLRDKYHPAAAAEYRRLIADRHTFITTNLVIAETYIIIRRTGGHAQAIRFLYSLRGSPRVRKVWSEANLESTAEEILEKYTDQDFSLVDAVSFAVMREGGMVTAFTFDGHFTTMGFQILPASA
jgi:predicted nucleic acid-binding protein